MPPGRVFGAPMQVPACRHLSDPFHCPVQPPLTQTSCSIAAGNPALAPSFTGLSEDAGNLLCCVQHFPPGHVYPDFLRPVCREQGGILPLTLSSHLRFHECLCGHLPLPPFLQEKGSEARGSPVVHHSLTSTQPSLPASVFYH